MGTRPPLFNFVAHPGSDHPIELLVEGAGMDSVYVGWRDVVVQRPHSLSGWTASGPGDGGSAPPRAKYWNDQQQNQSVRRVDQSIAASGKTLVLVDGRKLDKVKYNSIFAGSRVQGSKRATGSGGRESFCTPPLCQTTCV